MSSLVKCPECAAHHNILHGTSVLCRCGHKFEIGALPKLPHGCNSYAAIETSTGECVAELFETDRRLPYLNVEKYHLIPMSEHLAGLNK